jgi:hypothetical protein
MGTTCICGHRLDAHAPEPEPLCHGGTCGCSYPQTAEPEWTHTCVLDKCTKTLLAGRACNRCGQTR